MASSMAMSMWTCLALFLAHAPTPPPQVAPQDELSCKLVLSIDMTFWDRWDYSREARPLVPESRRVVRGQHFAPHIFVANPGIDDGGMARLRQDLRIFRPDGTVYFEELDREAHSGPFHAGNLLRTSTFLGVFFEPEDALGTYRAEVNVRDLVAGSSGTSSASIDLVEYEPGEGFASKADLELWLTRYRAEPDPSRIVPAILATGRGRWESERGLLHGAFRDLIDSNAWLLPKLLAHLDDADDETRRWILWIASRQPDAGIDPASRLEGADLAFWNQLAAALDPLVDPVEGREDINELWGMYWPRRSIVPILRLCALLAGVETGAVADIRLPSREIADGVPLSIVAIDVTTKILVKGMEWDPLVQDYCQAIMNDEGTSPDVRQRLRALLESAGGPSKR